MHNCFTCKNNTPNGECFIGQIEHCPLDEVEKTIKNFCEIWQLLLLYDVKIIDSRSGEIINFDDICFDEE